MPALVFFGPPLAATPANGDGDIQNDAVRIVADADEAVNELASSPSGFARFALARNPEIGIWVNRDNVRMIREAG